MPRFLILEDDGFKSNDLASVINGRFETCEIIYASDVASGISAIEENSFDLILIDMALPSHPIISGGGSPMSLLTGGFEIIFELASQSREDDCLIITQYPEIEIVGRFVPVKHAAGEIKKQFECDVIGCLEYSAAASAWKKELLRVLDKYENFNS